MIIYGGIGVERIVKSDGKMGGANNFLCDVWELYISANLFKWRKCEVKITESV